MYLVVGDVDKARVLISRSLAILPGLAAINNVGRETWISIGGEMPVLKAQLVRTYQGGISWGQRVAYIPENSANQPSGLAGLLGTVALGKRVAFDPSHNVLAWDPKEP